MPAPIQPATLSFTPDGTSLASPLSPALDDTHSLARARHVFVDGNGLPERWQGRQRWVIVETGFGSGVNFLATWQAWRDDPARCDRLDFVSIEAHPFQADDLARLHATWPELAPLAEALRRRWPALLPGIHRLHLDGGRVTLTLAFGDVPDLLPQLEAQADAFYLEDISPTCSPERWSPAVFGQLARLAAPDASLAASSAAHPIQQSLEAAGFSLERRAGHEGEHNMLAGRASPRSALAATPASERRALVVGAGVAGTSVAERLAARGWLVCLIDEADGPGQGASGNRAGVFRPLPSLDDNRLARITRAGFLYGRRHLDALGEAGLPVRWSPTGVLHLGRDAKQEGKQKAVVDAHQPPADYLRFVDKEEASRLAGWPLDAGGWWFPGGGWIQPPSLCAANLAAGGAGITTFFGRRLVRLDYQDGSWRAVDDRGAEIARAAVLVLANGVGIRALPQAATLPVRPARGQVSHLPASPGSAPKVVVCRLGYVSPDVDGLRCAGATFVADDPGTELRESEHRENLEKLDFILPGYSGAFDPATLDGRVGFRPASPDRLPMVGAIPAVTTAERHTPLADIPRQPGLYAASGFGARGLVWASLVGELLASLIDGGPLPLERELVDALDPARYLLKPPRPGAGGDE